jgi:RHS repeat-associated protein
MAGPHGKVFLAPAARRRGATAEVCPRAEKDEAMSQAAKLGDPVFGIDIHMVMVPGVPTPVPLPHPFVGVVFDPLGAALALGMDKVFGGGGPVLINWRPAGNTGTAVRGMHHVPTPPGVSFAPSDVPGNNGSLVTGSKTVSFGGSSAARLGSMVTTCNFPVNLPTSTCMAVATGAPVIVGGPDAMDTMAAVTQGIRTKWFSKALHKLLKPGKFLSWLICTLTGHPVDVMTGRVLANTVDFELPGPIPIVFERNYDSRDRYEGPLGPAWHHPLDASVNETHELRPLLAVRLPDGRESLHDVLGVGDSVWEPIDRYTLLRTKPGYRLTFWNGLAYHFERVPGAHVTHPLVRITDRCDNAIELQYRDGRLVQVVDSAGRRLDFETRDGRLRAIRLHRRDGSRLDVVRYAYNAEGQLAAAIDPAGHACRYAYKGGVMVKETNRNGLSFYFEYQWYDPDGWCIRTWGDGGIYDRRITYDEVNHVTLVDDSRGGRTHYYGNPAGLVDREVNPMGVEKRYEWHPEQYRKTAGIDGLGNRTEWAYDTRGNLVLERDPLGHETRWTYNELNVPVERIDAAGGVWKREHDSRGKLVRSINPLGEVTRFKHDRQGNLASVEDPRGRKVTLRHTPGGDLREVTSAEGRVTAFVVDDCGLPVKQVDALGGETRYERDLCGRVTTITRADGSVLRLAYDPEGDLIEHTDALGNVTRFRYEGLDKLAARIDAAGGEVQYLYDREEDIVGVINEAGERYTMERDLAGRVVKEHGFDGRVLELWYDRAGRCREMVDAQEKRTKIERDACGRMVKRIVPRPPVLGDPIPEGVPYEYAYDALGGLVRAKNDACEVTFVRDALGRVVEERCDGVTVASRYDTSGDRVGRSTSLGHEVSYDFDGDGALLGVTLDAGALWGVFDVETLAPGAAVRKPWQATFKRDALGNEIERALPGGVVSRWEREAMGRPRVQRISHNDAPVGTVGYRWRSAEQLAALIDTAVGPTWFEHDARGYLTASRKPDGSVLHRAADAVGNVYRTAERTDRAYLRGGRLERDADTHYLHDADGQLVEKRTADGKRWRYTWDLAGQLVEVTRPDGTTVTFAYDGLGRRVRKTFAGRTTRYVWDGNDLVHELAEAAETVTWVFEPGKFAPLAKIDGQGRYGVVTDHLGAPRMMADEAGALAWKVQLDVYGVAREDVAATACPWRWPGQYEDEETGLYYNRFRYYDPEVSGYVSQDPIGLLGGLKHYGYVDDPLSWVDPFGLTKSGCSPDPGLESFVARLKAARIKVTNTNIGIAVEGRIVGEIDVVTEHALIQFKNGPSSAYAVIEQVTMHTEPYVSRPVVTFINDTGRAGERTVRGAASKILVTNDFSTLVDVIK